MLADMAENVKLEMSSLTTLDTCVIQITNVAPAASLEQMSTLFGFLGKIEEIKLYPSDDYPILPQSRVCYVRYAESWSTGVAQHLTNTVFVDRALIVVPVIDGKIPDEAHAMSLTSPSVPGIINPGPSQLINSIQTMGSTQVFTTVDPNLTVLGLPQYPPLPANIDPSKIEEIRRTVYVGNLDSNTTTEQLLKFFNQVGEVKYVRMAGDETQPTRFAFVEFTDQTSVSKALQYNGIIFGSRPLKVNHSNNAIVKPQAKSSEAAQREIEEAMKRVREAQSLITAAIEPELTMNNNNSVASSGSGVVDATDSKKKESKSSRNGSRSRSRSRRRSRSRERKRSRSRERRRSRSRGRRSVSPRRSHSRSRRSRSRRKSPRKRSRSRDRKSKRSSSPRRSRSRSRDRKKHSRKSRSRTPSKSSKSGKSSRGDKSKSSPKREKSPKNEKSSPKKDKSPKPGSKESDDAENTVSTAAAAAVVKKESTPSTSIPFLEDVNDELPVKCSPGKEVGVKYEEPDQQATPDASAAAAAPVGSDEDRVKSEPEHTTSDVKMDEGTKTAKQESPSRSRKASRSGSKHKSPSHRRSHSSPSPAKRKSRSPSGKSSRRKSRSKSPSRKKRRSSRSPRRRSRSPRRRKGSPSPPPRRRSRTPSRSRSRSRSVRRKHRSPPRRRSRSQRRSPSYNRSRRRSPSPRRRSRTPRRRSRSPRKRSRTRSPPRKENKHKKKKDRDRSRERDKKKSKHRTGTRSPEKDVQTDGSDTKVRRDYDEEEKGYDSSGNEDHRMSTRGTVSDRGTSSPSFDAPSAPPAKAKKNESDDSDHRSQQMDLDSD